MKPLIIIIDLFKEIWKAFHNTGPTAGCNLEACITKPTGYSFYLGMQLIAALRNFKEGVDFLWSAEVPRYTELPDVE